MGTHLDPEYTLYTLEAQLPIYWVPVLKSLYNFILSVTQGPTMWVPGLLGMPTVNPKRYIYYGTTWTPCAAGGTGLLPIHGLAEATRTQTQAQGDAFAESEISVCLSKGLGFSASGFRV